MKGKKFKTSEEANLELNNAFYGEDNRYRFKMSPLVNNNHVALVLNDGNKKKEYTEKDLDI